MFSERRLLDEHKEEYRYRNGQLEHCLYHLMSLVTKEIRRILTYLHMLMLCADCVNHRLIEINNEDGNENTTD